MSDRIAERLAELMSVCQMIGYATSGNERANHRATRDKIKAEIVAAYAALLERQARLAGMCEPVAWRWRDNVRPGLPWYLTDSADWARQLRELNDHDVEGLFAAPPIDIAAVREVISELRHTSICSPMSAFTRARIDKLADKLTAALPKE